MKIVLREIAINSIYIFLNYFVSNIPCWTIRKAFYLLFGMRIGRDARVLMKVIVVSPWRITIGSRTTINEYCYLDGRGGLEIGSDCSISVHSVILSASHDKNSDGFDYREGSVKIHHHAWICANATILDNSIIGEFAIVSAGSVVKGSLEKSGIYCGIPAQLVGRRNEIKEYEQKWKPFFR